VLDGSDGVDRWFKIQYNTTTLTRRDYGWMFVYDVVFDDKSPTLFNVLKLNCKEDLYNMAAFNTQNNTAHAVLGEFGGWKKIPPKSAVLDLETFFCK
jgi:hypothetical protein